MLVLFSQDDVMVANAVAAGHGEVGARGEDDDQSGHNMVEALGLSRA